jgi:hypothetical protein
MLTDIAPLISQQDMQRYCQQAKEFLGESGRERYSVDELVFISLLDQNIALYERVKTMIGQSRFTVKFRGDETAQQNFISDFEIVAL